MGFFEDHLSTFGRGLDAAAAWCADRARSMSDRGRHARSFEAIRERVQHAGETARAKAETAVDVAKDQWQRRAPRDRDTNGATLRLLVVLAVVLAGAGAARAWMRPGTRPLSERELVAVQTLRERMEHGASSPATGLRGWGSKP